jgi:hypothetical protein
LLAVLVSPVPLDSRFAAEHPASIPAMREMHETAMELGHLCGRGNLVHQMRAGTVKGNDMKLLRLIIDIPIAGVSLLILATLVRAYWDQIWEWYGQ